MQRPLAVFALRGPGSWLFDLDSANGKSLLLERSTGV